MFALADCNNFYASCERLFKPIFNGVPIVVLSNNDGCVIARSNEAKDAGIAMGVPYFQIREEIKKHNIAVFSSHYTPVSYTHLDVYKRQLFERCSLFD